MRLARSCAGGSVRGRSSMTRKAVGWVVLLLGGSVAVGPARGAEPPGRYAVVVRKEVADGPWGRVVRFLEQRHAGKAFAYQTSPDEVRKDVGAYHPRWVCFVCPPTEN